MEYVKLGKSGLDVSRICLGCMSFGDPNKWVHSWVLNEEESRKIIKKALDLGINFFDTANVYGLGASEEILGRALHDFAKREDIVLATKVSESMRETPNGKGLSRKAIMSEVDASLARLNTDYIDLLVIHRWDYNTPIEETMRALNDLVSMGKVRYIGASSMYAWQFLKAQYVARQHGWVEFISMQGHYNLLYREEEREMNALCAELGVALTPYSPLAAGRLSRDWEATTKRFSEDTTAMRKYDSTYESDKMIVDRVGEVADQKGISRTAVALAWLWQKGVVAPVYGPTKERYLEEAISALDVHLSESEISYLEEAYVPHKIVGHI